MLGAGAVGKWHLGQRAAYLPAARGFDEYLGIPYSDDMGKALASACAPNGMKGRTEESGAHGDESRHERREDLYDDDDGEEEEEDDDDDKEDDVLEPKDPLDMYVTSGYAIREDKRIQSDPAGDFLPLIYNRRINGTNSDGGGSTRAGASRSAVQGTTQVLEQPVDLTRLDAKYKSFATDFIARHAQHPFFLYLPFSHVHTTAGNQPDEQYCGCSYKNATRRGAFGDALAETDAIVGAVAKALVDNGIERNTLVLFTGDNGPWMIKANSGGSPGLFSARYSGYWNVGKGSTWEGGIREAAFAYWPGVITPASRSAEVVSSLDVLPTVAKLTGAKLPSDRPYDGKDMSDVLLRPDGRSQHEVLFFYDGYDTAPTAKAQTAAIPRVDIRPSTIYPSAARYGPYKAHWRTGPGLGGCNVSPTALRGCPVMEYGDGPLLFNVDADPSETYPLSVNTTNPQDRDLRAVIQKLNAARERQAQALRPTLAPPAPDRPGEGPGKYGVCCDRSKGCDCTGAPPPDPSWRWFVGHGGA